ncbi:MAG: rubredoxin [Sutterella sp.]|nr:rubredoxin [Sutterella sp.]
MRTRIRPETRMQCRVCWFVYDPAEGLPDWGVEPGTPFEELPADWACPDCGHPKAAFLPADGSL